MARRPAHGLGSTSRRGKPLSPPLTCDPCTEDINGDGAVNVLDLVLLLLCFGQPAVPGCEAEDVNLDGVVNVLDLVALLLEFGNLCPP